MSELSFAKSQRIALSAENAPMSARNLQKLSFGEPPSARFGWHVPPVLLLSLTVERVRGTLHHRGFGDPLEGGSVRSRLSVCLMMSYPRVRDSACSSEV